MNPFKRFRVEVMFFWGVAGILVLLLLIVSYSITSIVSSRLVENTSHYQLKLLAELNRKAVNQIKNMEQLSQNTARTIEDSYLRYQEGTLYEKNKTQTELNGSLSNYINTTQLIHSVELYTDIPLRSRDDFVRFRLFDDLPDEPWISPIQSSDSAWLGNHFVTYQNSDTEVISFARKIYSSTNTYFGLLIINTEKSAWEEIISSEGVDSWRLFLDAGDRTLIEMNESEHSDIEMAKLMPLISQEKNGYREIMRDDHKYLMVWSTASAGWSLIEFTPWADIVSGAERVNKTIWIIGGIAIIAALVMIRLLVAQFTHPIRVLIHLMNQYPYQKYQDDIPADYKNEFGSLFSGYRKLIVRIQELYAGLERQYLKQKEVEVKALQTMINPHFLYNTLDQINWTAIESEQKDVSKMLSLLGRMLRITLSDGEGLITLEHELEHVQCYLDLQKIRWKDRLDVRVDVPSTLYAYSIPKVTLQPFIENAFRHGFHGRERASIEIRIYEEGEQIHIIIDDSGRGLSDNWWVSDNRMGGYALKNVKERIQTYFDENYGFTLSNRAEGGTRAMITIPKVIRK